MPLLLLQFGPYHKINEYGKIDVFYERWKKMNTRKRWVIILSPSYIHFLHAFLFILLIDAYHTRPPEVPMLLKEGVMGKTMPNLIGNAPETHSMCKLNKTNNDKMTWARDTSVLCGFMVLLTMWTVAGCAWALNVRLKRWRGWRGSRKI